MTRCCAALRCGRVSMPVKRVRLGCKAPAKVISVCFDTQADPPPRCAAHLPHACPFHSLDPPGTTAPRGPMSCYIVNSLDRQQELPGAESLCPERSGRASLEGTPFRPEPGRGRGPQPRLCPASRGLIKDHLFAFTRGLREAGGARAEQALEGVGVYGGGGDTSRGEGNNPNGRAYTLFSSPHANKGPFRENRL